MTAEPFAVCAGTSYDIPAPVERELRTKVRAGMTVREFRLVLSHHINRAVPSGMAELLHDMYREGEGS